MALNLTQIVGLLFSYEFVHDKLFPTNFLKYMFDKISLKIIRFLQMDVFTRFASIKWQPSSLVGEGTHWMTAIDVCFHISFAALHRPSLPSATSTPMDYLV